MSRERSEEEGEGATMMRLLEESRVKDLALEKASRLIDLLTVELQDQKRFAEQQLRGIKKEYENRIAGLYQKISQLEFGLSVSTNSSPRQLEEKQSTSNHALLVLATKRPQKRVAQTKNHTGPSWESAGLLQQSRLDQFLLFEEIGQIEEKQRQAFQELREVIEQEEREVGEFRRTKQMTTMELNQFLGEPMVTELPEQMDELRMVIQAQQRIILELRCLIDGVEEHEQAMLNHISDFYCPRFVTPEKDIETVFSLIKGKLVQSRQKQRLEWSLQNRELSNILEKLISLLQQSKESSHNW